MPTGGIGFVLSGLLTLPAFLAYYGWVYREPLLQFGIRVRSNEGHRRVVEDGNSAYAGRQLRGLHVLMALAEPEMTVVPFSGASAPLRYTAPLEKIDGRPHEPPSKAGVVDRE